MIPCTPNHARVFTARAWCSILKALGSVQRRGVQHLAMFCIGLPLSLCAQSNPGFNVQLQLDFSSAEKIIDLCQGMANNVQHVAGLRGNQIAAATSLILARKQLPPQAFQHELELLRDNFRSNDDVFGLWPTRLYLPEIQSLLAEAKRRQLDRRVIATIGQFFPPTVQVTAVIPVYFVAMGNENAAAFVRRVAWSGNAFQVVREGEGELVIVVNLTRLAENQRGTNYQFIDLLSTLAHETFHAVFGIYQHSSPEWKSLHASVSPVKTLAELAQNEGIAYYISMQQQMSGTPPREWFSETGRALQTLDGALKELSSPRISAARARELILNANLSGSFEKNYGATAGLLMAYAIDTKLGRPALAETITHGFPDFFRKYSSLTAQYDELPKLSEESLRTITNYGLRITE